MTQRTPHAAIQYLCQALVNDITTEVEFIVRAMLCCAALCELIR